MDSLTQIVLGAAVGELIAGRKIGNQAMLWGAVAGTIPDLDVLANPFLDIVQELRWHRSLMHSVLFAVLVAPLLGWLFNFLGTKYKLKFLSEMSFWGWTNLFFWGMITHSWLDIFTTWGTKIFYPFSEHGYALKTVFVVDFFYTFPFLILLLWARFLPAFKQKKYNEKRAFLVWFGVGMSSFYLLMGVINQQRVNSVFEENLKAQNIDYLRYDTKTTPLNILLWNNIVETKDGYYSGYYSVLDNKKEVKYHYFEKNWHLLEPIKDNQKVKQLLEVPQGYYTVETRTENGKKIYQINDLRFGQLDGWQNGDGDFVFTYLITEDKNGNLSFEQKRNNYAEGFELIIQLFGRALGN
ncbi:metal-dependent hydrolase [Bernardetia sp. OM2101]|uniref:metal-dependent hydrolase n=1 Tax=Bernardetia sp. OM2101 TaxID=3344876 RepID=UPI0035CEE39A